MKLKIQLSAAMIGAAMITSNAVAFEQNFALPENNHEFFLSSNTEFTSTTKLSNLSAPKIYSARPERLAFTHHEFSDPSVPRNRLNFGYAFNRAFYTQLNDSLAMGYLATYNSEAAQDSDAYFGQQGATNAGSGAWILDYKFTDHTSVALIHTHYYFTKEGLSTENITQTGLYFGFVF